MIPGWEDSLENEMATHFSIRALNIPWIEEPGGLQPMGLQTVRHDSMHACSQKSPKMLRENTRLSRKKKIIPHIKRDYTS